MVVYDVVVEHGDTAHQVEFDSEDGLEVLRFQLFSLTMVSPEKQTAEEEALVLEQHSNQNGQHTFASRVENYVGQVLQYEDPSRQAKARETVQIDELEEKALVALAKEGKRDPSDEQLEHHILFQLLLWFKKSFRLNLLIAKKEGLIVLGKRWVDSPPCFLCGANTDGIGMANPTHEELQFGGSRVELFRCRNCYSTTRFPRYNDTLKLLETRSGRCGEWANCFTLYCRAFGYQARLVLDFSDHLWTEFFSRFLGRWVHVDPCEGAFDKPLLYEDGWKKQLSYLIALSKDGVFDVTKRYTRRWDEVRLRRTLTSEENVADVVSNLTNRLRRTYSQEVMKQLRLRDVEEAAELCRLQEEDNTVLTMLPGRLTGSKQWREARGELGSSTMPLHTACPKRPCVDHFVSQVFLALGELDVLCLKGSLMVKDALEDLLRMFKRLQKAPYKSRQALFRLNASDSFPELEKCLETNSLKHLVEALGLTVPQKNGSVELSSSAQDSVDTALALPVAIENLKNLIEYAASKEGPDTLQKQLALFAKNERLSGAWAEASGENPPFGISSSAFDGLHSTKWEEPEGAKAVWMSDALGIVPNCQNSILEWFRAQNRMDGYKEEGSSSQDRQSNPTVHEVGEGSSQAEEGFPHAAFSITGTAIPGTLFGGMQSMVPNLMYANIGLHPGFQGTQGQFGVSQGNLGMAGFSIPPVNMTPRHQHVTGQGIQMVPTAVWMSDALGIVPNCQNSILEWFRAQNRMDGYKEEGSSSQDRQSNPTVHEVGEGSSQAEEGFPHAAFSITGTAIPGTLFGGMQSMVPNLMYANIGLHPGFQGTQGQFGVSQGNLGMAGFSIPPVNMTPRHQHVTGQGIQMVPTAVWMSDALGIVPNCQNSILEWFRAQNRMDGYKEEGSSSQDRQSNPTVHEVGEGSSQAEEGFPHAAFSITGTAIPGTLFGGMQSMVPNLMYANIGLHPGFQGTQGQFGVSQGNLGMAGFSIPPVNMTPRHQHVTGQGIQMVPTVKSSRALVKDPPPNATGNGNSWASILRNGQTHPDDNNTNDEMYVHEEDKEYQEMEKRKMNIVVRGIPKEDTEQVLTLNTGITDIISNKFGMNDIVVYGAHRVGKNKTETNRAIVCTRI
ncbi:hypothetical protein L7F22_063811 [Adiantum nelumboides]|nr:hypothetical protein [Adiantum nelumboides]